MSSISDFPELVLKKKHILLLRVLRSFYGEGEEVEMLTAQDVYDLLSGSTSLSYISRALRELEKLGLVESEEEAVDGERMRYYSITEHGARVADELERLAAEIRKVNALILKKAKFKLVKSGNAYRVKLD